MWAKEMECGRREMKGSFGTRTSEELERLGGKNAITSQSIGSTPASWVQGTLPPQGYPPDLLSRTGGRFSYKYSLMGLLSSLGEGRVEERR